MRWRLLLAVVFGLSISAFDSERRRASLAQGPPEARSPEATGPPPESAERVPDTPASNSVASSSAASSLSSESPGLHDPALFDSAGFVRFQFIQGRLQLDPPRHRQGTQQRREPGIQESITVTAQRGIPSLHYVCQTDTQHLMLSVTDASHVRIESWLPNSGEKALLVQPEFGNVTCEVTRGSLQDRYHANTLLHLRQQNKTVFDEHFQPLFRRLLRGRCIGELTRQTEQAMLLIAGRSPMPTLADVAQQVADLGSGQVTTRTIAERQLLSWGCVVLPLLNSMNPADLDAEQKARVQRVVKRLRIAHDDSSISLALMLVNDREYWSKIAMHLPEQELVSVNAHLASIGLQRIDPDVQSGTRIARTPQSSSR